MTEDEPKTEAKTEPVKEGEKKDTEKPLSLVDEIRGIRDEIFKARDDQKAENDRAEKLQGEALLSSTAGGRVEPTPTVEETPADYAQRISRGELRDSEKT